MENELVNTNACHSDSFLKLKEDCYKLHKQNEEDRQLQELMDDFRDLLDYEKAVTISLQQSEFNIIIQKLLEGFLTNLKNYDMDGQTKGFSSQLERVLNSLRSCDMTRIAVFIADLQIEKLQLLQKRLPEITSGRNEQQSLESLEKQLESLLRQSVEARDIYARYNLTEEEISHLLESCKCETSAVA